jgi:hypothetical protein
VVVVGRVVVVVVVVVVGRVVVVVVVVVVGRVVVVVVVVVLVVVVVVVSGGASPVSSPGGVPSSTATSASMLGRGLSMADTDETDTRLTSEASNAYSTSVVPRSRRRRLCCDGWAFVSSAIAIRVRLIARPRLRSALPSPIVDRRALTCS